MTPEESINNLITKHGSQKYVALISLALVNHKLCFTLHVQQITNFLCYRHVWTKNLSQNHVSMKQQLFLNKSKVKLEQYLPFLKSKTLG